MAITDISAFAQLTDADSDALAVDLDAIRLDIEDSLGERDARYIRRAIAAQRILEMAGRLILAASSKRPAWWTGTLTVALAKIIENMELGHNVMHGQWNWMNDPEIHSSTWEWDMVAVSKHWQFSHNVRHHKYTNVLGMDDDVGFSTLRVTRDQTWHRINIGNLVFNSILAVGFEWGIGLQPIEVGNIGKDSPGGEAALRRGRQFVRKAGRQVAKDYLAFPALTSLSPAALFRTTLTANLLANVIRNIWANAVIFCGHFPDGADKFSVAELAGESQGQWYLRQMLGSANFDAGPAMRFMSGNLCHQIEHHLYPDLPSNRLHEISSRVREICEKFDLPYNTGPFLMQYGKTWRTIAKLSLPDRYLRETADNAPETRSERMFTGLSTDFAGTNPNTGRRHGLKTAIATVSAWRRASRSAPPRGFISAAIPGPPAPGSHPPAALEFEHELAASQQMMEPS